MSPSGLLARLIARDDLSSEETHALFDLLMDGQLEPPVMAAILTALATKTEAPDEIVGAAKAMRARVTAVRCPVGVSVIDTCGTGGDGKPTFNVSTAVAIVAAAAGATVAKHGNRSNARPSGSAEVVDALGINVGAEVSTLERCLATCRVAFLYAVQLHPAMKHAAPVRKALGIRTIFNLVGPLTNPAGARRQLLGVNRPELVETMLWALRDLGAERAMVVHGLEGLCDISITAPTRIGQWDGQSAKIFEFDCRSVGVAPGQLEDIFVRSPEESAALIRGILAGNVGPPRDMVLVNAAAALWVAGLVDTLPAGVARARAVLDDGAARETLACWRATSHAPCG